jgi:hypothetical protein
MPREMQEKRWGVILVLSHLHHRGWALRAIGTCDERGRRSLHGYGAWGRGRRGEWQGSPDPARQASLRYRLRPRGVSETDPVETLSAGSALAHIAALKMGCGSGPRSHPFCLADRLRARRCCALDKALRPLSLVLDVRAPRLRLPAWTARFAPERCNSCSASTSGASSSFSPTPARKCLHARCSGDIVHVFPPAARGQKLTGACSP